VALGGLLFRREAVDFQRRQLQWSEAAVPQPLSAKILTWILSATVAAAVVFVSLAQFARTQSVHGYLRPSAGIARVYPTRPGTISAIFVSQGESVRRGQLLFAVATPETAANGEDVNAAKLAVLEEEARSIRRQIAAAQLLSRSQEHGLQATIGETGAEIASVQQEMRIQTERVAVTRSLLDDIDWLLARGDMSLVQAKEREAQLLDDEETLASLSGALAEREDRLGALRYTLAELPLKTAGAVELLHERLADAEQSIDAIRGALAYVMRAPLSGRIASLQATAGQSVDPQHLALQIVPAGASLQAILFIPSRAAGFVRPGQRVRLRYDAFPYENFGTHEGRILRISRTVLTGNELTGPVSPDQPAYEAVVALDRPGVDAYGKEIALKPGMQLEADIVLDKLSLARWLLDPLLARGL